MTPRQKQRLIDAAWECVATLGLGVVVVLGLLLLIAMLSGVDPLGPPS